MTPTVRPEVRRRCFGAGPSVASVGAGVLGLGASGGYARAAVGTPCLQIEHLPEAAGGPVRDDVHHGDCSDF